MLPADFEHVIEVKLPRVTEAQINAFRVATRTTYSGTPPTFATLFRDAEWKWLDRLKINMRDLLHSDQEYHYLQPLKAGDEPVVATKMKSHRERRGMHFFTLETVISCNGVPKILAQTGFVVREGRPN